MQKYRLESREMISGSYQCRNRLGGTTRSFSARRYILLDVLLQRVHLLSSVRDVDLRVHGTGGYELLLRLGSVVLENLEYELRTRGEILNRGF